jgi:pimeloyl-ACP methyl ester carboxylesterase
MLSKSLLSLAVAASLVGMSGCNISSVEDNDTVVPESQAAIEATEAAAALADVNVVTARFDAVTSDFPLGIDLIFGAQASADIPASMKDGTAHTGATGQFANAVTRAIDDLDGGISVLAQIDIAMSGSITESTVIAGSTVHLVKLPNAADVATYNMTLRDGVTALDIDALDLGSLGEFFLQAKADGSALTSEADAANLVVAKNLPAMIGMQPVAGIDYEVSVINLDGGVDNIIRISPLKPLAAKSKYIVVITGGITSLDNPATADVDEAKAIQSSKHYSLVKGSGTLFSAGLAGVRASVQGWEAMAGAILGNHPSPTIKGSLADGIALTSAFTTVDPTTVLKSMAYPGYWAASAVVKNNETVAAGILAGAVAKGAFTAEQVVGITAGGQAISTAAKVVSGALTSDAGAGIAYEHPRARAFELIKNVGGVGVNQLPVSAASGGLLTENVLVSQGAIELPQYTSSLSDYWAGSTSVGGVLDVLGGNAAGTTPPSDLDGTKNVTYRYPFAMEQRKIVAPIIMFEPMANSTAACTKPAAGWPVIIMQHGFTSVRTANLINATKLADNSCHAVVAMDLPHHGVAAASTQLGLGVDFSNGAATPFATAKAAYVASVAADATILDTLAERHEGFYGVGGVPTAMNYGETKAGDSGSLWIRLDNFQRGRDNMRQATMDLLNLNASLGAIDLNGDGTADLDVAKVNYIGHSLGGIVGTTFVAVNNDTTVQAGNANLPKIQKAILATPGGNVAKMIESSVGIGPQIIGGLAANGILQGTSSFESFIKVMQATIDSADPMNFIGDLAVGGSSVTPTLITEMVGNGTATNLADLVVPNNGVGSVLASGAARPESAQSPFVGTDPMIALLGATNVLTNTADGTEKEHLVAKYHTGGHGTFSSAGTSTSATSFDSDIAYAEMLSQSVKFLLSDENTVTTADDFNVLVAD